MVAMAQDLKGWINQVDLCRQNDADVEVGVVSHATLNSTVPVTTECDPLPN